MSPLNGHSKTKVIAQPINDNMLAYIAEYLYSHFSLGQIHGLLFIHPKYKDQGVFDIHCSHIRFTVRVFSATGLPMQGLYTNSHIRTDNNTGYTIYHIHYQEVLDNAGHVARLVKHYIITQYFNGKQP